QCVLHAKVLHGNPYDGHAPSSPISKSLQGVTVRRIGDKGYRGHNYPNRFKAWISGRSRVSPPPSAAVEPTIGTIKEDHRMRRNFVPGRDGNRINAGLAAAGYNFSLLLRWFAEPLRAPSR